LREGKPVALTPKAFDSCDISQQPDRLVTKPGTALGGLAGCVCQRCVDQGVRAGDSQGAAHSTKVPNISRRCIAGVSVYRAGVGGEKESFKRVIDVAETEREFGQWLVGRETEIRRLREQLKRRWREIVSVCCDRRAGEREDRR